MRALSYHLEQALNLEPRRPVFKLLAFDPALDTMTDIVNGRYSQVPLDLTGAARNISWSPARLTFTLSDPQGVFHPDTGAQKTYLADGAIIRLRQGDERVDEADWIWVFTGLIHGQVGWQQNRKSQVLEAKISAYSRDNCQSYKRRKCTSQAYTKGTELGIFLYDVAQAFLGLEPSEIRIPPTLGLQLFHNTNQLAQVTPWDAVSILLETVGRSPYFDGDGRLTSLNKNMQRLPDRYLLARQIQDFQIPERNQDAINKVVVTFLDSALERVDSPEQKLGSAQVTTGFFSSGEELESWWSDDHKQRASGSYMKRLKSINCGFVNVGCDDPLESYSEIDEFHGLITIEMEWWLPVLITAMLAVYIAAALIPDNVLVFNIGVGVGTGTGITISVGRVIQAAAMGAILLIMMQLGNGQYELWGTPFDYAYLEKQSIALQDGIDRWQWNEKEIKNDFLGSYEQADALAVVEWVWEACQAKPRRLVIEDDPALEIGDIVVHPDGRKFLIADMTKNITRGEVPAMNLEGFKVMTI